MPRTEPLPDAPEIPDVTLTSILGKGGQGMVFRGYQEFLDREVAVKVLHESVQRDLARFRQEATLLARLQHPNIVACYQAGVTEENQCYMVLEFVDGSDLHDYVKHSGVLDEDTALALIADVARGLQHGYETNARMIHRDVKPENVLLQVSEGNQEPRLRGKIVDLGLARCLEESMELTQVGTVMGTPSTMAPEQFDAPHEVDHRTDIYGLGCVLFFAMTGDPAFKGSTMVKIYGLKTGKDAIRPHQDLDISEGTSRLLDSMLAQKKEGRPATYDDLLESIRQVRAELKGDSAPKGSSKKVAGAATAAVVAVAALIAMRWGSTEGAVTPASEAPSAEASTVSVTGPTPAKDAAEPTADPAALAPVSTPLLAALSPGETIPLFPDSSAAAAWWSTGADDAGPESASGLTTLWSLQDGQLKGTPLSAFEDEAELTVTKELVSQSDSPTPYFRDGVSAVSHQLPDGAFGISGTMALSQFDIGDFLLGGLVLRRGDGSYLELDVVVTFPNGDLGGVSAKRQSTARSAWFDAESAPLYAEDSAVWRGFPSKLDAVGPAAARHLSGMFLRDETTVMPNDVLVIDFEIRIDAESFTVELGDGLDLAWDLEPPADLTSNGFCELIAFSRGGSLSLRDWKLVGLEPR